jgi:hypothetical protein
MPTYLRLPRFNRDWERLSPQEQARFRAALAVFAADLAAGSGFRPGLRVQKMAGHDIWEMTWAPDGRATFCYGQPVRDRDAAALHRDTYDLGQRGAGRRSRSWRVHGRQPGSGPVAVLTCCMAGPVHRRMGIG